MKVIIFLILFLSLIGYTKSNADPISDLKSVNVVHDEKYGDILEKYYVYHSLVSGRIKIAKIDLGKVVIRYNKTRDFDTVLMEEGEKFKEIRDSMVQNYIQAKKNSPPAQIEKIKDDIINYDKAKRSELVRVRTDKLNEIITDIKNAVAQYADKNQIRAVFNSRMPKLHEGEDITSEIISILNHQYVPKKEILYL